MLALKSTSRPTPKTESADSLAERSRAYLIISQHQASYPVNVTGIAKELGINVFVDPNLPSNVSGVLRKDKHGGESGYLILVRADHPRARQRFTVAHELGHFMLHRSEVNGEIRDDEFYRALPGPLEREANEFAADLLMPWPLINRLQDDGVTDLNEMATKLGVSRQALAIRLGLPYDQDWA